MGMELKKAIDQISKDKGIDRGLLVDTLEEAIRTSVVKKYGDDLDIEVSFNEEIGEIEVYQFKVVVDEVTTPSREITLEEAKQHDSKVQVGDEVGFRMEIEDLGRIAAQSAKQVIIQRMRDAEHEIIYEEYKDRIGEIVSGIIQRRDRNGWVINLGRTEALLPKNEQIPRERFRQGDRVQAQILDVKSEGRGPQVVVTRSHPDYMKALFKREVPEIDDGIVTIMGVARDPGLRAKVAVISHETDVDPVGACVGVKGSRIQNIVQEFKGERIDIVLWNPDITTYAANALSPARISRITVDEEDKTLEVVVPDDQLTPAIGRKGQNVKLASKILGWRIDIFTETKYGELYKNRQGLEQLARAAQISVDQILEAGFEDVEAVAMSSEEGLLDIEGIGEENVEDLKAAANLLRDSQNEGNESETQDENHAQASDTIQDA
ncbi:MAG: transcription termination factor NusA [Desulfoplanes sp.]|nr:transcription termination factor NusA [Desulfoplanes sp.]